MTPEALPLARSPSPAKLHGWRLRLARIVWTVCAIFIMALCLAFIPINPSAVRSDWLVQSSFSVVSRYMYSGAYANYVLTLNYLVALVSFGVAAFIVWRKSDDGMALLVALGLLLLPAVLVMQGEAAPIYLAHGLFWGGVLKTSRDWLIAITFHYLIMLFFIFPDGHFAPRWMKWLAWGGLLASAGLLLGQQSGRVSWEVWVTVYLLWAMLSLCVQVFRYWRISSLAERQQTKWFVAATTFGVAWLILGFGRGMLGLSESENSFIQLHLQLAWLLFLPLGIGIGVLRRGLWGADPIINRTLVYGALTLSIILAYVLVVGGLSALFQSGNSILLSALVTGVIAFLFQPLRQRLQRLVNRLMYGERDDPATVLSRLGQRLETAVAPETVLPSIVETVAQTLRVPYVGLQVNSEHAERSVISAEWRGKASLAPTDNRSLITVPLVFQSETLGHLLIAPRAPDEAFTAADQRLLNDLARQAAPAVHAYRLTTDLQRSRERIVTAREEERRRLRRDLHDGLGPALASQTLKLDAALDLLDDNPQAAHKLLSEVKAQTQTTVADIRRLVYELRPPALDELGLVGALRAHIQSLTSLNGLRVTVDVPDELPPLSAAVEVAAYRIVLEAITNVLKHAQARHCLIQLKVENWRLEIGVEDDGVGWPAVLNPGVGLASMRERAEELSGTCLIENLPTGGARVYARLPIL